MRKRLSLLGLVMAFVMVFSVGVSASWNQYQGNDTHTGKITGTAPLISQLGTLGTANCTEVSLNASGNGWSGVDTAPVMYQASVTSGGETATKTLAYVVYNGVGNGARVACYDCSSPASSFWDIQLNTGSTFQLSTPYIDEANNTLYVASSGNIYKISNINTTSPGMDVIFSGANGQINTPITKHGNYIYFGSWVGNGTIEGSTLPGKYYQVDVTDGTSKYIYSYSKGFYWAGAISVTANGTDYIVFGGDNGYLYYVNEDTGFVTADTIVAPYYNLSALGNVTAGNVRSSISSDGTYIYFTSQGGYLWRVPIASLPTGSLSVSKVPLGGTSTSTPAISSNDKIYVGYYNGFTAGGVRAVDADTFALIDNVTTGLCSGFPVQSSIVVYSDGDDDYIYFTTNSSGGAGYCYQVSTTSSPVSATMNWRTSDGTYTLQGMAACNGYLTFGNDHNKFYVIH